MERFSYSTKRLVLSALILAAAALVAPVATAAAPIQGTIDFGGSVTFDTMSLATATRVTTWNSSFVLQSNGDFSSISPGTNVSMAPTWIFNPSTVTNSLWNVGGFTFDLNASIIVQQTSNFLNITGTGTISGNGFAPTPGQWSFTASNSNGTDRASFGFQTDTATVPEPASITFLGIGAFTLAFVARRHRK
jgi:hypothetical protein